MSQIVCEVLHLDLYSQQGLDGTDISDSVFPVELPDRPNRVSRLTLKNRFPQLSSTRSKKALSTPLPLCTSTATALSQVQSHGEYANHATHAKHGAGQHRGGSLGASVKREGFVPKLKHAVSSLRMSKSTSDQDSNFPRSDMSKFAYPNSSATTSQPSPYIKRKPVSLPEPHVRQDTPVERFVRLRAPRNGKLGDDAARPVGQPLSPYFTASQHLQLPLFRAPSSGSVQPTNSTMNNIQTSLPALFDLPAQPQYGNQSFYYEPQQSGLDLQHPIVIDGDDDCDHYDARTVSEVSARQYGASLSTLAGAQSPLSPQNHGSSSQYAQPPMAIASGSGSVDEFRPAARIIWPHKPATVGRRAGRFIDSREAMALQEQLDRNLAQQLQYEESEIYNSASSLMVPFILDVSAGPLPYSQNEESASTPLGTHEAPIDLDSEDEWGDTDDSPAITPVSTIRIQRQADGSSSRSLSDEMDWQPSSPTSQSQIDEDAILAQLLQEQEDQQAVPATRECPACNDQFPVYELPSLAHCAHPPQTCTDCFAGWIAAQLEGSSWQTAKCPETKCSVQLEYHEIQQLASPETFARYDTFITRAACNDDRKSPPPPTFTCAFSPSPPSPPLPLSLSPSLKKTPALFRWCSACTSGQIHDSTSATGNIFTCFSCGHKVCTIHENTWHEDETCDEYEYRTSGRQARDRKAQEEASKKAIGQLSKKCPGKGCVWRIEKNEGCDHMTCEFDIA